MTMMLMSEEERSKVFLKKEVMSRACLASALALSILLEANPVPTALTAGPKVQPRIDIQHFISAACQTNRLPEAYMD